MSDVERPIAPARIASSTCARMRSSSAGVACRAESPMTISRIVVCPTFCATLSGIPAFSSRPKNSRIVLQPTVRARSPAAGAEEPPSPVLIVVIPCVSRLSAASPDMRVNISAVCPIMSMKPGETTLPEASMTVRARAESSRPMAAMRPPRTARSAA